MHKSKLVKLEVTEKVDQRQDFDYLSKQKRISKTLVDENNDTNNLKGKSELLLSSKYKDRSPIGGTMPKEKDSLFARLQNVNGLFSSSSSDIDQSIEERSESQKSKAVGK